MASKVKPEKALALLLHEISDCLLAAGSESGSQQSGVSSLTTRMRTVLDSLLDKCVDENIGDEFWELPSLRQQAYCWKSCC